MYFGQETDMIIFVEPTRLLDLAGRDAEAARHKLRYLWTPRIGSLVVLTQ